MWPPLIKSLEQQKSTCPCCLPGPGCLTAPAATSGSPRWNPQRRAGCQNRPPAPACPGRSQERRRPASALSRTPGGRRVSRRRGCGCSGQGCQRSTAWPLPPRAAAAVAAPAERRRLAGPPLSGLLQCWPAHVVPCQLRATLRHEIYSTTSQSLDRRGSVF